MWLEWACDEDCEQVWIREDIARLNNPSAVLNLDAVLFEGAYLVFDCVMPMVVVNLADTGWGEDTLGIWSAHEDEDADVMLYRRFELTEDVDPGDVVFGWDSIPEERAA